MEIDLNTLPPTARERLEHHNRLQEKAARCSEFARLARTDVEAAGKYLLAMSDYEQLVRDPGTRTGRRIYVRPRRDFSRSRARPRDSPESEVAQVADGQRRRRAAVRPAAARRTRRHRLELAYHREKLTAAMRPV